MKRSARLTHKNVGIVDAENNVYTLEEARLLISLGLAETRDHKLLGELGLHELIRDGGYYDPDAGKDY